MKIKNLRLIFLPVLLIIAELLPFGVRMRFANPEGEPWIKETSYFSLLPFGYGNVFPLLTAVLTCVLLIVLIIFAFKKNRALLKCGLVLCAFAAVFSLLPIAFKACTVLSGIITLALAAEFILLFVSLKTEKQLS